VKFFCLLVTQSGTFHGGLLYMILHITCNKGRLFAGVFLPVYGFPMVYVLLMCMLLDLHGYCYSVMIMFC
jgi:hypothetical protein